MAKRIVIPEKPNINVSVTQDLLGQSIRFVRTSSGLTIEDAASLSGVSKQSFSDAEQGKAGCRLNTIIKITKALGIKLHIEHPLLSDDVEQEDGNEWR
jgi:transcriptional regulator with XRE-family HTH domain